MLRGEVEFLKLGSGKRGKIENGELIFKTNDSLKNSCKLKTMFFFLNWKKTIYKTILKMWEYCHCVSSVKRE